MIGVATQCVLRRPTQRGAWYTWRHLIKTWEPLALTAKVTAQCAESTERRTTTSTPAHLRSARVAVVGPAASPPASAPIGHARPTAAEARAPLIEDDRSTYVSEVFGRNMDCVTKRATSSSRVSYCDLRRVQFKREVRFAVRSGQMGDVKATPIPSYLRRSF